MEDFLLKYHRRVLKDKKERVNEDGSVTTVHSKGVVFGDKVYNLPSYDPETKKDMTEDEQRAHFWPFVRAGMVEGYPLKWNGEIKDHPANKAAREGHKSIEKDMEEWRKKYPDRFK